jgi:hypothetical protein
MRRRAVVTLTLFTLLFTSLSVGGAEAPRRLVVPVVGSTAGAEGASFRTALQMHNPSEAPSRGHLLFRAAGAPGLSPAPRLEWELAPYGVVSYDDVVAQMGASGLGSLDVVVASGALPVVLARAFDDGEAAGTKGVSIPALREEEAIGAGQRVTLIAPADPLRARFNVGIRTLSAGARVRLALYSESGELVTSLGERSWPAEWFEQSPSAAFLGQTIGGNQTLAITVIEGSLFAYATMTDNRTNDPSFQLPLGSQNVVPTALAQQIDLTRDRSVTIRLQAVDPDDEFLLFTISTPPSHGSAGALTRIDGKSVELTYTPMSGFEGSDSFTFTVDDANGGSSTAAVTLVVGRVENRQPTAFPQQVSTLLNTPVEITLSGSDPDGDPLVFSIGSSPSSGTLDPIIPLDGREATVVYRPAGGFIGTDVFHFLVDDERGGSAVALVTIEVVGPPNTRPVAHSQGVTTTQNMAVAITLTGSDADGDALTFNVTSVPSSGVLSGTAPNLTYTPAAGFTGNDSFTFVVNDGTVDSAPATVSITVNAPGNTAPVANSQGVTTTQNTAVAITLTGSDPDGDTLTFSVTSSPANGVLSGTAPNLTYTPASGFTGNDSFTFVVNDGTVHSAPATVSITVNAPGNTAPVANSQSVTTTQNIAVAITLTGSDPDGDTLTFSVTSGPANGTLSGTAPNLTYTPAAGFTGNDSFTFVVNDGTVDSAPATVSIGVHQAPAITSASSTSFAAGAAATFTVTTSGSPAPALSHSGALPAGITFTDNGDGTATIGGTAAAGSGGLYPIVITATNVAGSADQNFTITVCNSIILTNPANATGATGSALNEMFSQSGAVDTAAFTLASGTLPAGVTLAADGVLSGTPSQSGSFPITVTVTDANGCSATGDTYTLIISCPAITVNNPVNATGTAGEAFDETFTETGGSGTITFTLEAGTLPAGLTLAADGVLSGTPTETGSFPVTVTSTDANGCRGTGATYTIVIGCPTITVTNPSNAAGTAGDAFSETFTQAGGIGTITFTLESGTLPAGLALAADGVLSGTPTETGSFPVTVTSTDANGCSATGATYTIVIGCQTITVTNPSNASGAADAAFEETFTQTNGIGAITWTLDSGTLPAGLTLGTDGVVSGTPTETGSFPITVTATDANGCSGTSGTYTIAIGCPTITVTNPANAAGTAGAAFSETFTESGGIGTVTFTTASTLPAGLTLGTDGILSGTPTGTGSFPIIVTVTDANGCSGTGTEYELVIGCQTITVTNPANATGAAGAAFSETFTESDAIGSATFTLASGTLPTGLTLAPDGVLSGTPTQGGTFEITVTVTDANGCTGTSATYTLEITCPAITVDLPANADGTATSAFSETFTQSGGQGTISYTVASGTLPAGLSLATNGVLSGTPTETGSFPITVTATDENGCSGTSGTYTIVIACQTITVNNPANANGTAGSAFSETFTSTDAVGAVDYALASGALPAGLTLGADGVLSGTPTETGSFPITVTATDENGCSGTSATYTIVIGCQTITVTNPSNTSGTLEVAFSETFTESGAIGTATFTLESGTLPAGVSLAASGVLSGTPTESGAFPITVTVTDGNGCTGTSATYSLTIDCQAITVTTPTNADGTVGTAFNETFTQSGASGTATFTIGSGTLPAGLSLGTDGVLSGTPTEAGSFPITVTATDSSGCTGTSSTYTIEIVCQTITVTNPATATGTVDAAFNETFTQSGGIGTTNFSTSSTLPAGLTLATDGVLSGTPGAPGSYDIIVVATDANGCTGTGTTYTLVIACQTITVTNPIADAATFNQPFSETFTQTGVGTHTPAEWSVTGTLPAGITIDTATGVLSGTPTQVGTFPITVTVTDANGCSGTGATYTLSVAPVAVDDTYPQMVIGNVGIDSSRIPYSVLDNDGFDGTATISAFDALTTQGGTVSMTTSGAGVGQFTYQPLPGFEGNDTFTYTLSVDGATATATVTIPVSGMIWFVNSAAVVNGNGTLASPFNCLVGGGCFNGSANEAGDNIFLYAGTYTGGLTLKNNQKLIGQGSSSGTTLAAIAEVTVPSSSDALPLLSGDESTVTISGAAHAVTLGQGNTLRGFTIGDTAGFIGLWGDTFGTLSISEVTINGTGAIANLNNGSFGAGASLTSITSTSSSGAGVSLTAIGSGTLTIGSTSISGSTSEGILVSGAVTSSVSFGDTTVSGGTVGVLLATNSGGTRTFGTLSISSSGVGLSSNGGGALTVTGATTITNPASTGIDIQNLGNTHAVSFAATTVNKDVTAGTGVNLGANAGNVTFASLAITTNNGTALLGTNNTGSITVIDNSGAISATGGPAVNINNATVAAIWLSLGNVSSTNSSTTGINLLRVSGSLTATGGTISGPSQEAVKVATSTANITYAGTINKTLASIGIDVQGQTAGTVTFSGATKTLSTSTGNGVNLVGNTGGTINFSNGGLAISTTSGIGFNATGGGTVSVTTGVNNNTISSGTGTAVNIVGTTISGTGVTFASVSNSGAANGIVIDNAGGGAFTANGGSIANATTRGVRVNAGNGNVNYAGSVSTSGGASRSVEVSNRTGGTVTLSGAITDTSLGVSLTSNSGATITFGGNLSLSTGVNNALTATGGGTINLSGSSKSITPSTGHGLVLNGVTVNVSTADLTISPSGSGRGVNVTGGTTTISNTATHGLNITTSSGDGVNATAGGTLVITGSVNRISSAGGVALNVQNTTIGASGLTFRSISANGGANGIVLVSTGTSGGLTVTSNTSGACGGSANVGGSAVAPVLADCSGGFIQNTTGADGAVAGNGIYLSNTRSVSLTRMRLSNHSNHAIYGREVTGFTLLNSHISGVNGSNVSVDEGSVSFDNLYGSAAITSCFIEGGFEDNIRVQNGFPEAASASLNRLTISDTTVGHNGNTGNNGVLLAGYGTAVVNATVQNSRFTGARANLIGYTISENASGDVVISGNVGTNNHPNKVGSDFGFYVAHASNGAVTYQVSGNSVRDAGGSGIEVGRLAGGSGSMTGSVTNNTVGAAGVANSGSSAGSTIVVGIGLTGTGATHTTTISGNTLRQYTNYGIRLINRGTGNGYLNATVQNNNIQEPSPNAINLFGSYSALRAELGAATGDDGRSCLHIIGNAMHQDAGSLQATLRIFGRFGTRTALPGLTGAANAFLENQNTITGTATKVNATSTLAFQSTCPPS